jgi:hypothetical protein
MNEGTVSMSDLIKASTNLIKASTSRPHFPVLPITLRSTTAPIFPGTLPISATLNIKADGIYIRLERTGANQDEVSGIFLSKSDMVRIDAILTKDIPAEKSREDEDYSTATIRHRDPFGVVPFFETTFQSDKSYWIRALLKAGNELFKVEVIVADNTKS